VSADQRPEEGSRRLLSSGLFAQAAAPDVTPQPVGCRYSISCGRGELVLVDQTTEEVAAVHRGGVGRGIASCDRRAD
jgi:hypothetical protein